MTRHPNETGVNQPGRPAPEPDGRKSTGRPASHANAARVGWRVRVAAGWSDPRGTRPRCEALFGSLPRWRGAVRRRDTKSKRSGI